MPYTTGVLGTPASGEYPSLLAARTWVHQALLAGGWTFSVENTFSNRYTYRMYSSAKGWLAVHCDSGVDARVRFVLLASWNQASRTGVGVDVNTNANSLSSWEVTADGTIARSISESQLANATSIEVQAGAGSQWWAQADPTAVILASRVGTNDYAVYAGDLVDVPPAADTPRRLYLSQLNQGAYGGTLQEPGITTAGTVQGACQTYLYTPARQWAGVNVPDAYSGAFLGSRVPVFGRRTGNGLRGFLHRVLYTSHNIPVNGDTAVFDGVPYVCMRHGGSQATWVRVSD